MASPVPVQQPQTSPLGTPRTNTTHSELNTPNAPTARTEKVWVGVRIRPLLSHEKEAKETEAWRATNQTTLACIAEEKNVYHQSTYQYDRVFGQECTSEEVYTAAAQPMVRSAMEGYNCTLFAYGQTGSGKTTTMKSIMRHAAKDIFAYISHSRDREFVLKMCAIEVYNEVVHDLLVDTDTNLKINDDREKGPVVVDLTEQSIESGEHLLKLLKSVESRRQVRETRMNRNSSRSHLVLRLYVESRLAFHESDDEVDMSDDSSIALDASCSLPGCTSSRVLAPVLSTINFVDLAGSERLSQSSMATERDRDRDNRRAEGSSINLSLLTLGKVIRALGKREFVNYRESNLTRILQPSLSGNSRMAIICTLSPASGSVDSSRGALHFANHAKAVTMRPVLNEVRGEQALIHKMEAEIHELRRKLDRMDRPDRASRHDAKQLLAEKDAELKAKEEQMKQAIQERAALERRLTQMEKFIIRGGSGSPAPNVRHSLNGLDSLASSLATGGLGQAVSTRSAGNGALVTPTNLRASWTPGNPSPLLEGRERASAGRPGKPGSGLGRSVGGPARLLLDYLLPPNVRSALNRLSSEAAAAQRVGNSPATGKAGQEQPAPMSALDLRMEIGKLQAPEGSKAQAALTALQAEVRCYSQQPDAAAAVAAASAATPETADRLLSQLTQLLTGMERRQAQVAGLAGPSTSAPAAGSKMEPNSPAPQIEQQRQQATEDEASLMELLRAEVARLQRLRNINLQANQAIESLLGKMAALEQTGLTGASGELDGLANMPNVLERLHDALQAADALEEGEEDLGFPQDDGGVIQRRDAATETCTPVRQPSDTVDDGEATSAPRYDSPATSARAAATTTCAALTSPSRLTGSKLPRDAGDDDQSDRCGELIKSPRRGLMTSPHAAALVLAGKPPGTPNSRLSQMGRASASVRCTGSTIAAPEPVARTSAPLVRPQQQVVAPPQGPQQEAESPRGTEDTTLRRMRTPSMSLHASDLESVGHRTGSTSSRGGLLRLDTERAKRIVSREKDAIHAWYSAEVSRLKTVFRTQAQTDIDSMREAVAHYRGMFEETQQRVERLNLQKQLLIKQVLQLELTLDEAEQQEARNLAAIEKLTEERDAARSKAMRAEALAQATMQQLQMEQSVGLQAATSGERPGFLDETDWDEEPTTEGLLTKICDLWHKLHVPLVYRSRFFLMFRSRELIYLQMEHRRLNHRYEQEQEIEKDYFARNKPKEKAKRALDLERKVLAQALRYVYNDRDRELLYESYGVPPNSKGRKLQLLKKLWDPTFTINQEGMEACANVVCNLAGPDATQQFMQLVFGNTAEVCARPTQVSALVTTLVRRVTTPRQRKSTSLSGLAGQLSNSMNAQPGFFANAGPGGVTPRRNSSNLLASIAGRVNSMIGQQGAGGRSAGGAQASGSAGGNPSVGGSVAQSGAATPRSVASGSMPQLPTGTQVMVANAGAAVPGLGPMARGLAGMAGNQAAMPPLPPTHPSSLGGAGGAPPPASTRGRTTYAGGSRPYPAG